MVRGDDGLFRLKQGGVAPLDPNLTGVGGALEGSNVNLVDAMVRMVNLARSYETQITMIKTAQDNAAKSSQIMNLNS
jgi:flagellar basal-body rod protein FlgF